MMIHCDVCGKAVGTYLYGCGGVEERAWIGPMRVGGYRLPDIVCNECIKKRRPADVEP